MPETKVLRPSTRETMVLGQLPRLSVVAGSIAADGRSRTYVEVAPEGIAAESPLVIAFHGSGQTAARFRAFSGYTFDALAAREGVRVVYPDGYRMHWNDVRASSHVAAGQKNYDDVAFTRALIQRFSGQDRFPRVFVVGYSNGGQLVMRLIHELPALLAGAAIISATELARENLMADDQETPLPVLLVHGTRDRVVPYAGGTRSVPGFRPRARELSHAETARYYARRNGITDAPRRSEPSTQPGARTSVETLDFSQSGKPGVRSVTIVGGGHVVPNPWVAAPRVIGRTHRELDTGAAMWEFFTHVP
ncbi:MAG: hypothetical protein JWN09_1711 [Microbacteriaceae bacterium]|nr:hypothetical protein [Microbacteriaceae bacterium]